MMKRLLYITLAALLAAACVEKENLPSAFPVTPEDASGKVLLDFSVVLPGSVKTKADIDGDPDIDNIYVAVFSASGFFNEWVPATINSVTEVHYDGTAATKYDLTVALTMSESRLRLHFIGNCPEQFKSAPPITGISAQDLEEIVLSKIRSQITDPHNDGYWQKVILPKGIKAQVTLDTDGVTEIYATDQQGNYLPTAETLAQFPDPIVLVRNFARIYLSNLATNDSGVKDVTISKFALAYAPAEGPIAPILMDPYISDSTGVYVPNPDTFPGRTYLESFFINYQDYPLVPTEQKPVALSSEPYFYSGHTPANLVFGTYPDSNNPSKDANLPTLEEMTPWDAETPLYVYERELPKREQPATRIIIYAHKDGEVDGSGNDLYKYYALDIVNDQGEYIPILRNNTYTIKLLKIELGSGESSLSAAAGASSATVYGDINTQHVTEISNGVSSIGTSYTEMMYIKPGTYEVMFRYIATNEGEYANKERLDLVSLQIGSKDESNGAFTPVAASAANGSNAFLIDGGDYKVWIDTTAQGKVIPYVRSGNAWVEATQAQIADDSVDKWGKVKYTTVGTASDGLMDSDGFFTQARTQTIRVIGTYENKPIFRDVIIKLSPRRKMKVNCQQKYVMAASQQEETIRIRVPDDLSRSIFPLQFQIEPAAHSLTPNGDVLPVTSGETIVPGASGPAYYFIKELTWEAYEALGTVTEDNLHWKYFDCRFKTTKANNASEVYVHNPYFEDNADAHDNFDNYYQRQFSALQFTQSGTDIHFTCTLDAAHNGTSYWWDPAASQNCLSDSYRVLPYAFTIALTGLDPKSDPDTGRPVDEELAPASGDDTSLVILGNPQTPVDANLRYIDLTFVLAENNTSGAYGIALNTSNLTDNPTLYAANSASGQFKNIHTSDYTLPSSTLSTSNSTTFTGTDGITFTFTNTARVANQGRRFGTTNSNTGYVTITAPTGNGISNGRITKVEISYYNNRNAQTVTYTPTGGSTTSNSKAEWNGTATQLRITMGAASQNNRNIVSQLKVYYSYEE